jgi:sugar lactone lactonase YvrE
MGNVDSPEKNRARMQEVPVQTVTEVRIDLHRGDNLVEEIIASTPNNGSFRWTVSPDLTVGQDYSVQVTCVGEPSVLDRSEQFMINYGYDSVGQWGSQGEGNGQFVDPEGIAVGNQVFVADGDNHRIQKFTREGTFLTKWNSTGDGFNEVQNPYVIAIGPAGNVYIADDQSKTVVKFDVHGTFLSKWDTQYAGIWGLVVNSTGQIYATHSDNNLVGKYAANGAMITSWGRRGQGNGEFNRPSGVAVDGHGYVYVTDFGNDRIQKFTSNGTFVMEWGSRGDGPGEFRGPRGIAVDNVGYVFVADSHNHRIQKFTSDGKFVVTIGSDLDNVWDVCVDDSGFVYAIKKYLSQIKKFRPSL